MLVKCTKFENPNKNGSFNETMLFVLVIASISPSCDLSCSKSYCTPVGKIVYVGQWLNSFEFTVEMQNSYLFIF